MQTDQKVKPWAFTAQYNKPFKVRIDLKRGMCVNGIVKGREFEYFLRFTRPVPVKKGDVFKAAKNGIILNGKLVPRNIIQPKGKTVPKISWIAKRLRVAIFPERDRTYDHKKKKFLNKWGAPYWVAYDLRSYQLGCGETVVEAMRNLLEMCVIVNQEAERAKRKGGVIRDHRSLLTKDEIEEMEQKARKKGIILDGVEVPAKCDWDRK
jgi:hypothetical protein